MSLRLTVSRAVPDGVSIVGLPVLEGRRLPRGSTGGTGSRTGTLEVGTLDVAALAERGFDGKVGETCVLAGGGRPTVVAVGMGAADNIDADVVRRAMAAFVRAAWRDTSAAVRLLDALPAGADRGLAAQGLAEGAALAAYQFTRYKGSPKPCRLEELAVVAAGPPAAVTRGIERGRRIAEAQNLARDLVNEPAGTMTPRRLAEVASELAGGAGLELEVLDEVAIANDGLGGLRGVSQGSSEPPRLIRLRYQPPGARRTVALVGKGITFDSGGLSLKTAEGMETMKTDMSGAAAVLGAMSVLSAAGVKVGVLGIVPATENMPSGTAIRPGDVLKIRNGKTVEVLNTDAEGRLVLADGLSLAVEAKPDAIVDLATLTGACVVALGEKISGLMGNHDGWVAQVRDAAGRAGEKVWPLPLPPEYRRQIDSEIADIKNVGPRWGGTLTAGLFLKEFVGDIPWAHLDIAGPARSGEDDGYNPRGGTGVGVRTLVEVLSHFQAPKPAHAAAE